MNKKIGSKLSGKLKWLLMIPIVLIFVTTGCNHYDSLNTTQNDSSPNGRSHNPGEDCNKCHHDNSNGASSRWWYVAGTAYQINGTAANSGEVQLWTGPAGTGELLYKMAIDGRGNFFTERIINFKAGYFPIIIYHSDTFKMNEIITGLDLNKSCNNCHGNNGNGINTPRITLN